MSSRTDLLTALLLGLGLLLPTDAEPFAVYTNRENTKIGFWTWGLYHPTNPPIYYAEDYYLLYSRRNYYGEEEANLNIVFMQGALKSPFRPAYQALVPLHTEEQQRKYRSLIRMSCNLRILQDYLWIGRLYDMPTLYFFHKDEKEDLLKSLRFARYYYEVAQGYWTEVKKHAVEAWTLRHVQVNMPDLEDAMTLIVTRDVDWQYDRILRVHLERVEANIRRLEALP